MYFSYLLEGIFWTFQHAFQSHELVLDAIFYFWSQRCLKGD